MFVYSVLAGVPLTWIDPAGILVPDAFQDLFYSRQLRASGLNISFALVSGTLPDGVSMDSSGLLTGTPATLATYTFTVRISDSQGKTSDRTFQIPVTVASGSAWYNAGIGSVVLNTQDKNGLPATIDLQTAASTWWDAWDALTIQAFTQDKTNLPSTITLETTPSPWWTTWDNT